MTNVITALVCVCMCVCVCANNMIIYSFRRIVTYLEYVQYNRCFVTISTLPLLDCL